MGDKNSKHIINLALDDSNNPTEATPGSLSKDSGGENLDPALLSEQIIDNEPLVRTLSMLRVILVAQDDRSKYRSLSVFFTNQVNHKNIRDVLNLLSELDKDSYINFLYKGEDVSADDRDDPTVIYNCHTYEDFFTDHIKTFIEALNKTGSVVNIRADFPWGSFMDFVEGDDKRVLNGDYNNLIELTNLPFGMQPTLEVIDDYMYDLRNKDRVYENIDPYNLNILQCFILIFGELYKKQTHIQARNMLHEYFSEDYLDEITHYIPEGIAYENMQPGFIDKALKGLRELYLYEGTKYFRRGLGIAYSHYLKLERTLH